LHGLASIGILPLLGVSGGAIVAPRAFRGIFGLGASTLFALPLAIRGGRRRKTSWGRHLFLAAACLFASGGCTDFVAQGRNADGVSLFQMGRYPEALDQFQEAVRIDPANADGYYNLAATYHRLGRMRAQTDDLERAETFYRQCLALDMNRCDGHRGLAVLLAEKGRTDEAFRLLQAWADQQPWLADPKIELARLHEECGDRAAAKERLVEAVGVDPNNARQWAALGKIREETGEYAQAMSNYQRSLQLDAAQPEVAARVTALQALAAQPPPSPGAASPTPAGPAQTVAVPPAWR
jgi:tetratricopeptide (TPR) repeat protein